MSVSITRAIRIGGVGNNAHNHRLLITHLLTTPRFRLSTSIQQRQKHLSISTPPSLLLVCNARRLSSSSSSSQTTNSAAAAQADNSTPLSSASITFGKIFFPSLCAITFTLGIWQTKRYFEKLDMVTKRKDDLLLDPLTFDEWTLKNDDANSSNNAATTSLSSSYRRVTLHGKFDHTNTILIGPRGPPPGALATSVPNSGLASSGGGMSSSQQGYWVVTPLIIGDERRSNSSSIDSDDAIGEEGDKKKKKSWWLHRILFWKGHRGSSSSSSGSTLSSSTQNGTNSYNTASNTANNNTSKTTAAANTVWINRGWIPRHFINQANNQIIQSWDEPSDMVTLQTMESQTERGGGMFTPPSRLDSDGTKGGEKGASSSNSSSSSSNNNDGRRSVRKLLWMDREAMEQMTSCNENQHPPLFVQINTEDNENNNNNHQLTTTTATTTTTTTRRSYPVRPSQEYVGEFKVTPEVHAGYAVTWFGLSGAGVIMTRKLLTRGR